MRRKADGAQPVVSLSSIEGEPDDGFEKKDGGSTVDDLHASHRDENPYLAVGMSLGVAGGAGIGLLVGLLVLDNPAMGVGLGIPFGIALGLVIAIAVAGRNGPHGAGTADRGSGDEMAQ